MYQLFEQVQSVARMNRESLGDGKALWGKLSPLLETSSDTFVWKSAGPGLREYERAIIDAGEGPKDGSDEWLRRHFIRQTVRIPLEKPCTVRSIAQVALNIGQHVGMGGNIRDLPRYEAEDFVDRGVLDVPLQDLFRREVVLAIQKWPL